MKDKNEIILTAQSNQMTLSKMNVTTPYQKRILYAVIDSLSPHIKTKLEEAKGKTIGKHFALSKDIFDVVARICYKMKELEPHGNYGRLRQALKDLREKTVSIELKEGVILDTGLLLQAKHDERSEDVEIVVSLELYQFLADLSKGATMFQMKVAMSFRSIYAMKLYEYISMQREFKTFQINLDTFRFIMNCEDKFEFTKDLKKYVLDIAVQQINESETTDLKVAYTDRKKGKKVIGFTFFISKTENAHDSEMVKARAKNPVSLHWDFSKDLIENFKKIGLVIKGKNLDLIKALKLEMGEKRILEEMERVFAYSKEQKNPQGYMITALQNLLKSVQKEPGEMSPPERRKHAENLRPANVVKNTPTKIGDLTMSLFEKNRGSYSN